MAFTLLVSGPFSPDLPHFDLQDRTLFETRSEQSRGFLPVRFAATSPLGAPPKFVIGLTPLRSIFPLNVISHVSLWADSARSLLFFHILKGCFPFFSPLVFFPHLVSSQLKPRCIPVPCSPPCQAITSRPLRNRLSCLVYPLPVFFDK